MEGVSDIAALPENAISITFDDQKTDPDSILKALCDGGVTIPGRCSTELKTFRSPFSYE
jgi:hypothetical protein